MLTPKLPQVTDFSLCKATTMHFYIKQWQHWAATLTTRRGGMIWKEPSMIPHLPLCMDHHVFPSLCFFFFFPGGPRSLPEPFEVSSPNDAAPAAWKMLRGLGASSFMLARFLNELSLFCYFFCIFASFMAWNYESNFTSNGSVSEKLRKQNLHNVFTAATIA